MYFQGSKSPSANIAPSLTQPLTLSALPAAVGSVLSSGLLLSFYFFKLISILFCTIDCTQLQWYPNYAEFLNSLMQKITNFICTKQGETKQTVG